MLAVPRFAVGIPGTSGPPREATLAADRILARGWPAGRDDESAVGQAAPQRHGTSLQMRPLRPAGPSRPGSGAAAATAPSGSALAPPPRDPRVMPSPPAESRRRAPANLALTPL